MRRQKCWGGVGSPLSVAARICREAGSCVSTNLLVRDMDLDVPSERWPQMEVVVDGLPLFGGAQLAVDTTLVSTLHCDGTARRGAADRDGVAWEQASLKERTHPDFQILSDQVTARVWWWWQARLLDDGQMKRLRSFASWRKPGRGVNCQCLSRELNKRGGCGGFPCSRVQQQHGCSQDLS